MPEAPFYGTVASVMTRNVVTVTPDTSIRATARLMADNKISGVPVVDDEGCLLGLITESDLLRSRELEAKRESWWLNMLAEGEKLSPEFVDYVRTANDMVQVVMHKDVTSVEDTTPLEEVAHMMVAKSVKRLPVIKNGKIVGIVSRADLVEALGARHAKDTTI
jgi:CBS domain-containing protein